MSHSTDPRDDRIRDDAVRVEETGHPDPAPQDREDAVLPQEPEGEAMGAVSDSDRNDPITGRPLNEGASGDDVSAGLSGHYYRNPADDGLTADAKSGQVGEPTSTPRSEPTLDDLTR